MESRHVSLTAITVIFLLWSPSLAMQQTYIINMAMHQMPTEFSEMTNWYTAALQAVSDTAQTLYTYSTVAHGFSAQLTQAQAEALSAMTGILSVFPDKPYDLHTTRTPEFLELTSKEGATLASNPRLSDIVVGVLDTGVWPELESYNDAGYSPVPASWKGECEAGDGFEPSKVCNKKLVGARFFSKGYEAAVGPIDTEKESRSPRDDDGHGTHTSTTAVGGAVANASLFGFASGTAQGMASKARVAIYKVCWSGGCFSSDILAALDKAVEDGVNVLSLSLGGSQADYIKDTVAIGSFAAMEKGIFVSCSAGNSGPGVSTLSNVAPWVTTVGAGTLDREFPVYITLGNGKNYTGASVYSKDNTTAFVGSMTLPFVYAVKASSSANGSLCVEGSLDPKKVTGKIVLCDRGINARVEKGLAVKKAGGVGMVLVNGESNGDELVADSHLVPAANVGYNAGEALKSYLVSDPNPTVTLNFADTKTGVQPSPVVASFSSRGPNRITPGILKPDLIGPGVNILAGWTGAEGPTGLDIDMRKTKFNVISGTSMSCPHVSGLAALLKAAHPEWSPAAIRSALMTTAYNKDNTGSGILDVATSQVATPFAVGAGHVDPVRASNPGLVYDLTPDDYVGFLCALKYTDTQISGISRRRQVGCEKGKVYSLEEFNYPSFAVKLPTKGGAAVKHKRTLTNVGPVGMYKAKVVGTVGDVKVVVEPAELSFNNGETQSFTVSFSSSPHEFGTEKFARLDWSDGKHVVRSPIAFTWG